jgi:sporulation protein YlmC with PRC-barrel domain
VGEKLYLVPPNLVKVDAARKVYEFGVDKEWLANASEFNAARWDEISKAERIAEIDRYYGQEPRHWLKNDLPGATVGRTVTKASQMIGSTVKNSRDEKVGSIDDLIVDLGGGRVVQVVVSSGGFLGVGDELNAVPPMAFRYDPASKTWFLDVTKEQLTAAPRFKSSEWPNFGDPAYVGGVYKAYRVDPYFSSDVRTEETLKNAGDQSNREGDLAVTRRIRQEIVAREGLSLNARNVKIITSEGSVTLRGRVNTEEEKRMIAEIARQYAAGNRVENLLEVKGEKQNF